MAGAGVSMDFSYVVTPFLAWLVAGSLKFAINSIRTGQWAINLIGYGGLPSNHTAIVSSTAALIAFKEGIGHPAFGAAITLAFIVALDAGSLRRHVGKHAEEINRLGAASQDYRPLRERLGHSGLEIGAGILVGIGVAAIVNAVTVVRCHV
jgi:acid phosphatase family membrane protein YuiD